jgi:hypothetical protein
MSPDVARVSAAMMTPPSKRQPTMVVPVLVARGRGTPFACRAALRLWLLKSKPDMVSGWGILAGWEGVLGSKRRSEDGRDFPEVWSSCQMDGTEKGGKDGDDEARCSLQTGAAQALPDRSSFGVESQQGSALKPWPKMGRERYLLRAQTLTTEPVPQPSIKIADQSPTTHPRPSSQPRPLSD